MKISGFVVAYNREKIIETCLQSIRWVDELIVIDKSSTDKTSDLAKRYADKYIRLPWSPTVEGSRARALEETSHDFVVFLDDDECLSAAAATFFKNEVEKPRAQSYRIPCRHYVLGLHDETAYYWPESHIRAFFKGAIEFNSTVHGGYTVRGQTFDLPVSSNVCFHNFSHSDVATWIEKTNRYTNSVDRVKAVNTVPNDLGRYAKERIDYWLGQRTNDNNYVRSVAILRAIYDIVDTLKFYESERGTSGDMLFDKVLKELRDEYGRL